MELKPTAYVVLGILAIHPHQSGYEIRKTIQQSVGFFWGESFGQIYPTLKRLLAEKLIVPSSSGAKARASRQEYSITPAGRELLQQWLAVPFRDDPPRDEFLLKLFFSAEAGPAVAIEQLTRFQQRHRSLLATLEELGALARKHDVEQPYPGFAYWMMTLNYGIAQLKAGLQWSESTMAALCALRDC
jgi:DNA-binding PadR family transcriptional regulator